jgi:predicted glycoside hydrolase/deacetylase ChbG (UPF0249 family)
VHLNLSEGLSLTGPIPGLTDDRGVFPGKEGLRRVLAVGEVGGEGLLREMAAQVERVLAAGLRPDHLDTHQHFFLFPIATPLVMAVARAYGIRALRRTIPIEPAGDDPSGFLGGELLLYRRLAPALAAALNHSGLTAPAGLWGMPFLNRLNAETLFGILENLPPGEWELMVHPGYADPQGLFSGPERKEELTALTSPVIRDLLRRRQIRRISVGELFCASCASFLGRRGRPGLM